MAQLLLVALRVVLTGESDVHRRLLAHRDQLTDEVQAACHRVHGDIWLEKLEIRTHAPAKRRSEAPAMLAVDLSALLGAVADGNELKAKAGQLLAEIQVRIPGTIAEDEQKLADELEQLVAEARELLLARATDEA